MRLVRAIKTYECSGGAGTRPARLPQPSVPPVLWVMLQISRRAVPAPQPQRGLSCLPCPPPPPPPALGALHQAAHQAMEPCSTRQPPFQAPGEAAKVPAPPAVSTAEHPWGGCWRPPHPALVPMLLTCPLGSQPPHAGLHTGITLPMTLGSSGSFSPLPLPAHDSQREAFHGSIITCKLPGTKGAVYTTFLTVPQFERCCGVSVETPHVRRVPRMPELALREPPAGARGLCWAPQPRVGAEVGTPEPGLGKGVGCGAHVCRGPCTQGLPARCSHPGCACLWSCRRPAEPVPFFHIHVG